MQADLNKWRTLSSAVKWEVEKSVQISLPSSIFFCNRSETSSELMIVKVQFFLSQEDMLNELTTTLPGGRAVWLTLPLSEMAADAKSAFCFTECCSSIWDHRRNLKALLTCKLHLSLDKYKLLSKTPQTRRQSPSISPKIEACEGYQGSSVIIFLPVILGLWSQCRGVQRLLAPCVHNW